MMATRKEIVMNLFSGFQKQLDAKHDKHERLVKLSRDCTIHSKRTIFLLHRKDNGTSGSKSDKHIKKKRDDVLEEARSRLVEGSQILKKSAEELQSEIDPLRFHSAYTSGVQEFIEALSFYIFLKEKCLLTLSEAREWLTFPSALEQEGKPIAGAEEQCLTNETTIDNNITVSFPLTNGDYLLGLADLTGELMRLCINATGNGDMEQPFFILQALRDIYSCYLALNTSSTNVVVKELPRKIKTLLNSLRKIENVCYNIKVRGTEVSNKLLVDMLETEQALQD